jgi:general secretion pathway protein E
MSNIQQLIENDERIVNCKKNAKFLFKDLKKTDPNIKLMQCQSQIAQNMGFKDWFDLYNTVKTQLNTIDITNYSISEPFPLLNKKMNSLENFKTQFNHEQNYNLKFEMLLDYVLTLSATHIHIKAITKNSGVYIRLNGETNLITEMNSDSLIKLAEAIDYNLSNKHVNKKSLTYTENQFDPFSFQSRDMLYDFKEYELGINFQCVPIVGHGFEIFMKITNRSPTNISKNLLWLGYSEDQHNILTNSMNKDFGSTIFAGSAGSGKSTAINSMMAEVLKNYGTSKLIVNIGHVNESNLEGVTHITLVHPEKYDPETSLLQQPLYAVRHIDPDLIFIDEIKDKVSCKEYAKALDSGLNITTKMHAGSALSIISRLLSFGLSNETVAQPNFLNTLVYQKILPVNCPTCCLHVNHVYEENSSLERKEEYFKFLEAFKNNYLPYINSFRLRNPSGCEHCHHTGLKGRTVCAEVIEIDDNMRHFIRHNQFKELTTYWKSSGNNFISNAHMVGKTAQEHAFYKMFLGQIDPLQVYNHFGEVPVLLPAPKK